MPKKKKEAAKPAIPPPAAAAAPPPPRVAYGVKDPILSTGPPKDYEDWKVKNARAKELIMSTLVPGSEPWKIAEPLENASDIWKALEARYAPKRGEQHGQASESSATNDVESAKETNAAPADQQETGFIKFWDVKNFYTAIPNRDQRLLWAILYGGTTEAETWFAGAPVKR